jgi:hypothetical protein
MSEDGTDTDGPSPTGFNELLLNAERLRDSDPEEALALYTAALQAPRSCSPRLIIHALTQKCNAHAHLGQVQEAKNALTEAYGIVTKTDLPEVQQMIEHRMVDLMVS